MIQAYPPSPIYYGELFADEDFFPALDAILKCAQHTNIKLLVNSSFRRERQHLTGAIVPPAKMSNHLIGHALDINPILGGQAIRSNQLINLMTAPVEWRMFIGSVRMCHEQHLRWGGDFRDNPATVICEVDPVHFDDAINLRDPAEWHRKFGAYQT